MKSAVRTGAKFRPILFSGAMVRAILDGRKTQTRRVVKPQPHEDFDPRDAFVKWYAPTVIDRNGEEQPGADVYGFCDADSGWRCPYGAPGTVLWVREMWQAYTRYGERGELYELWRGDATGKPPDCIEYFATVKDGCHPPTWRPSIHMPRWACRLWLRVKSVRVERVQEISEADVLAEGFSWWTKDGNIRKFGLAERHISGELDFVTPWAEMRRSAPEAFAALWDSINGASGFGWAANPWVWVVEFERIEKPEGWATPEPGTRNPEPRPLNPEPADLKAVPS